MFSLFFLDSSKRPTALPAVADRPPSLLRTRPRLVARGASDGRSGGRREGGNGEDGNGCFCAVDNWDGRCLIASSGGCRQRRLRRRRGICTRASIMYCFFLRSTDSLYVEESIVQNFLSQVSGFHPSLLPAAALGPLFIVRDGAAHLSPAIFWFQ